MKKKLSVLLITALLFSIASTLPGQASILTTQKAKIEQNRINRATYNNIKKVILPKENEKDVEVLDEVIKKNIKFVYVSNYEEVLKEIKL